MKKLSVLLAILAFLLCFNFGCKKSEIADKPENTENFLSTYQSMIKDDALIKDVVIPGSHDAGTKGMMIYAETQDKSIKEQLEMGVRYFDIRVDLDDKNQAVIYHGIIKGGSFLNVIKSIAEFLDTNPTEYLILDFQHFGSDEAKDKAYSILTENIKEEKRVKNDTDKSDVDFINSLCVKDCRGKCLIFWGNVDGYLQEDFIFKRNNDSGTKSDCALHSYYFEDEHTEGVNRLISALHSYIETYIENEEKGIFVLQCQLTPKVLPQSVLEKSNCDKIDGFIFNLRSSDKLNCICVVMRDFVSVNKCALIISLNVYKDNVKEELQEYFTKNVSAYLQEEYKVK